MNQDHGHDHEHAPTQQRAPRTANPDSIIRTMSQELARVNDNRIFLLSLIDDLQGDLDNALLENASLKERLEQYESDVKPTAQEVKIPDMSHQIDESSE